MKQIKKPTCFHMWVSECTERLKLSLYETLSRGLYVSTLQKRAFKITINGLLIMVHSLSDKILFILNKFLYVGLLPYFITAKLMKIA